MTQQVRRVISLGATGSIGVQAADVISRNPDRFDVVGLAATGSRLTELLAQIEALEPETVAVSDPVVAEQIQDAVPALEVLAGPESAAELAARPADVVLNGIAGAAGLAPTVAALTAGTTLALANKESLIIGGPVVTKLAAPGQIVPVDSEHSALAQSLMRCTGSF